MTDPQRTRRFSDESIPYDKLDPPVVRLCRAINAFSGVATVGSCGGHDAPDAFLPADEWSVTLKIDLDQSRPTLNGWLSLEFITWAIHDLWRAEKDVALRPHSAPPFLNDPGMVLTFTVDGRRSGPGAIEPDEVATVLEEMRGGYFVRGEHLDLFYAAEGAGET